MKRLVSGAAARDQCDLAWLQVAAAHELPLGTKQQDIGMRGREPVETFFEHRISAVDQLFHGVLPVVFFAFRIRQPMLSA